MTIIRPELRTKTTARGGGAQNGARQRTRAGKQRFYRHSLIDPAANNNFSKSHPPTQRRGPASSQEGRCGPQSLSFPFPGNPRNSDIPCLPGSVVISLGTTGPVYRTE